MNTCLRYNVFDLTELFLGLPHISVSPTEATISHGNSQTIHCTVTSIPAATSIAWFFTPEDEPQYQLNTEGCDQKYIGGSTQNPSLTVTKFQLSDAGSYVCCASNDFGTASCDRPSVLKFGQYKNTLVRLFAFF